MLRPYTTQPRFALFRPRHHRAQLGAHLFDRMLRAGLAQRLEPAAPAAALGDPLAREAAGLDVGEDALHRRANFRRYDLGASCVVAVLRGVADRVAHELHAAAIHQVHDQLELVHALEVGDLRRVSGSREGLDPGLAQRGDAAAQDGLLAEQIGLRFLAERRLEHARAGAADPRGIGERIGQRIAARILVHRDERRHAPARLKLAAHQVSGGFRAVIADSSPAGGAVSLEWVVDPGAERQGLPGWRARQAAGPDTPRPFLAGASP